MKVKVSELPETLAFSDISKFVVLDAGQTASIDGKRFVSQIVEKAGIDKLATTAALNNGITQVNNGLTQLNNGLAQSLKQGWHTIFLSGLSFFDPHTKRQPVLSAAGSWQPWSNMYGLTFSPTAAQGGLAEFVFPKSWDQGVTQIDLLWSPTVAWGGAVFWHLYGAGAWGVNSGNAAGSQSAISASNAVPGSVHICRFANYSWGGIAPGNICRLFPYRVAENASDTLACAVHLLGAIIYYRTNKANDS